MTAKKRARFNTPIGIVRLLYKEKTGVATYILKGGHQTAVDRDGVSLDMYIHAIYDLILQTGAKDILMIGCGGGTLATMLTRAGRRVVVVDIDKTSFVL